MIKKVLKEKVEHVTQIDGQQVILAVELSFNFQNGQFTISCPIKTKAVSRDPVIQKAIITQVGTMYLKYLPGLFSSETNGLKQTRKKKKRSLASRFLKMEKKAKRKKAMSEQPMMTMCSFLFQRHPVQSAVQSNSITRGRINTRLLKPESHGTH
jgi:hypothetical protein